MKLYLLFFGVALVVFLAVLGMIYYRYTKEKDKKGALFSIFFLVFLIGVTLFGKYLLIYKPLFVLHMILLVFGWIELFRYVFTKRANFYLLFSPFGTIVLFFVIGLIFAD